MDIVTYALSKKYTDNSIAGGGAVKGKNCIVSSIDPISGGHRVTFQWTLDNGTVQTDYVDVMDGQIGPQGIQGPQGVQGPRGLQGVQGIQGAAGAKGDKGDKGDTGNTGAKGADGAAASISIGAVSSGASPSVVNAGTSQNAVLDFTLPKGDKGDKGDKGEDGADGKSFEIKAQFPTETDLRAAHPTGNAGDAYFVGADQNPDLYVWLTDDNDWFNNGKIAGVKGDKGDKGDEGFSPVASVSKTDSTVTISIRDKVGQTTATVSDGAKGVDGKSAYEVAVDNGFVGTEAEWLQSLIGQQGPKGDQGDPGVQGPQGPQGNPGTTNYNDLINKPTLGTAAAKDSTDRVSPNNRDLVESQSVYSAITTALASIYTPAGDLTCAELTSDLLIADNVGKVYELSDNGTTSDLFLQGANQPLVVGDQIGIINAGQGRILFNYMANRIDLSAFQKKDLAQTVEGAATVEGALNALSTNKQSKTLDTPLTIDGTQQTTIEGALGALLNNNEHIYAPNTLDANEAIPSNYHSQAWYAGSSLINFKNFPVAGRNRILIAYRGDTVLTQLCFSHSAFFNHEYHYRVANLMNNVWVFGEWKGVANCVSDATAGDIAILDANGNLRDDGISGDIIPSDASASNKLVTEDTLTGKVNTTDLAAVATSGDYADLTNKPSIPSKTSDLTNDSNFTTTNDVNTALANYTTTANLTTLLAAKQNTLTFDNAPTENSNNPVKSGGVYAANEALTNYIGNNNVKNILNLASFQKGIDDYGITFVDNGDGTYTATGTATGRAQIHWNDIPAATYGSDFSNKILTGCPNIQGCTIIVEKTASPWTKFAIDSGNGATISEIPLDIGGISVICRIDQGTTVNGAVFKPMIRDACFTNSTYQPYAMTNKELTDNKIDKNDPSLKTISQYEKATLSSPGWYKIYEGAGFGAGSVFKVDLGSMYNNNQNGAHAINIVYGYLSTKINEICRDAHAVFSKIRVCYTDMSQLRNTILVYYSKDKGNDVFTSISSLQYFINKGEIFNFVPVDESQYTTYDEFNLGTSGLYENGVKVITEKTICANNAGAHNSIYRGKYLGSSVTAEQYAQISAGTFDDLFIGDYWTISNVNYRIAAFDYWLNTGDTKCTTHHIVLVPDTVLYTANMNTSGATTGGFSMSAMHKTYFTNVKSIVFNAFGSAHMLHHRESITNSTTSGKASGSTWEDSTVELMNECMVYGHNVWGSNPGYETGIDRTQLPLFAMSPDCIAIGEIWWLRDVVSSTDFAVVSSSGAAHHVSAYGVGYGVRPAFAIKG